MDPPPFSAFISGLVAERNVRISNGISYGPRPRHRLDLYEPQQRRPGAPVCVFFYGGSWQSGARATYGFVGAALATRGITTAVADYRLYPDVQFPGFIEDGAGAVAFVRDRYSDAGARPVIVAGHSAGAHIAAMIALDRRYLGATAAPVDGLIGLSGPYAFDPTTWTTTRQIFKSARSADDARPVAQVTSAAPPALVIHGASDTVVKPWNARDLASAYRARGRTVTLHEFSGLGHTETLLAIARPLRWIAPVLDEMINFAFQLRS
jgi:acetyl esterase/lipase